MALKFLNKKGWHTGSLRNVENVWKAEQKHEAEQKKLEELRKQIQEERERSELRLLQEQAGLVPRQDRLDFLYDSGLAVGKGSSDAGGGGGGGFKALEEALPSSKSKPAADASSSAPGALFEDKPHSANDAWRKLHSDPLLLIRQREQEALARIRNNPVQMALIRKSVEGKKQKEKSDVKKDTKERHKKHITNDSKPRKSNQSDSEDNILRADRKSNDHKGLDYQRRHHRSKPDSDDESSERGSWKRKHQKKECQDGGPDDALRGHGRSKHRRHSPESKHRRHSPESKHRRHSSEGYGKSKHGRHSLEGRVSSDADLNEGEFRRVVDSLMEIQPESSQQRRQKVAPKLSEEERAARLREMQEDAELHEEQRWKRLKKADENDACEAAQSSISGGRNFLDAAHRSVYGAGEGGSSTIEESVRRRSHYSQGRSAAEGNAFRR